MMGYSIENPMAYIDANIIGFINILESCRHHGVKNLSYASSSSVYGLNESYPFSTSDNVDHPMSLYAATKKSNELMAHTYSHLYGISTTGLRFFTVYGPWGHREENLDSEENFSDFLDSLNKIAEVYASAASIVKTHYPNATFTLVGSEDSSPDALKIFEVMEWDKNGWIHYLGSTNDVRPYIKKAHIFVLPSYHEGLPRSTIEAMATPPSKAQHSHCCRFCITHWRPLAIVFTTLR